METKVLVVDDSIVVRQVVSFMLTTAGYVVVQAVDGNDALTKLNTDNISMVITDLNMPGMDGIELIKQIRRASTYRFMPVVMLTTQSQECKRQEGKAAGATCWICKPFTSAQLVGIVKKVFTLRP
ncbi:MAG TPA: two-component system response regulator [Nitrospiraceae bacterium]|jgi:two-component system chemotaxis response regulator CheY|nr:two-component system response regulator [Nitrospiraceae bacterium]